MMLIEETPLPDAALPVTALKAHLRLGSGFGPDDVQDVVLVSFLRAAIAAVEARTSKALIVRDFSLSVTEWHVGDRQALPVAPVRDVAEVAQVAADGTRTIVDAQTYWLERDAQRPRLRSVGASLPAIQRGGSAEIRFEAGFADDWDSLPDDLCQAVLMLAAHYYEYRHDTGLSDGCMPFGVSSLIERYKLMRLGIGASK
ncbi:MAG: head-tail connector protein [Sulfitobacter sp.]